MGLLFKRVKSFFLAVIPVPPLFFRNNFGDDVIVTVTEKNAPATKISLLLSTSFFLFLSYITFYACFSFLPSIFFTGDPKEKTTSASQSYFLSSNKSDAVFGAPFSLYWNMSIKSASESGFLSKKPLICNGLENGINGDVECYFKSVSVEDLDRSSFFSDPDSTEIRDILTGADLVLRFKGNHLNSIGYLKKFGNDEQSKTSFNSESSKIRLSIMDTYERRLSENSFDSKNSPHFVTLDINYAELSIKINYTLFDNYAE